MAGMTSYYDLLKIFFLSAILFLPALFVELSWIRTFIPLPAFYILIDNGEPGGSSIITKAVVVAAIATLFSGSLAPLFMSLSFLPLAYVLARSVLNKETVLKTGVTGTIVLLSVWVIGGFVYGAFEHVNTYKYILHGIDVSLVSTFNIYQESSDITPGTLAQIEIAFDRIRNIVPVIFPSIILITVLTTVWINLLIGNMLIKNKCPGVSTWKSYSTWMLPEQLVWFVIASGLGLIFPLPLFNKICLNGVLILGTLYFFQGLAVLSSIFNRWSVPTAFKFFVFTLILIQAYGIILLAIAGLLDVWFDFRKLGKPANEA